MWLSHQELGYCQTVVLSVTDDIGVRTVMDDLLASCNHQQAVLRCAAVTILKAFCEQTRVDYSDYVPQLFRGLIHLFTDTDTKVLHASWDCLNAVTKVGRSWHFQGLLDIMNGESGDQLTRLGVEGL